MSDFLMLPQWVAGPVGLAIVGAFAAFWKRIDTVEKRERKDCAEQIEGVRDDCAARITDICERLEENEERVKNLEGDGHKWRERWALQVERGAQLASMPRRPEEPPPRSLPPPDWHEDAKVRQMRATIEQRALDDELERYNKKTTPPQGTPGAPRRR